MSERINLYLHYLTEIQEKLYQDQLYPSLREQVTHCLLSSGTKCLVDRARFILNIVGNYTEHQATITDYFLRVFSLENSSSHFVKLEELHAQNQIGDFFQFFANHHILDPLAAITRFQARPRLSAPSHLPKSLNRSFIESQHLPFTKLSPILKKKISLIPEKDRLPLSLYKKVFSWILVLKNCSEHTKSRIAQLIVAMTTNNTIIAQCYDQNDLRAFTVTLQNIAILYGEEFILGICATLTNQPVSIDEWLRILQKLNANADQLTQSSFFELFMEAVAAETYEQAKTILIIELERISNSHSTILPEEEALELLLQRFGELPFSLNSEGLSTIKSQYEKIQCLCKEWAALPIEELVQRFITIKEKQEIFSENLLEVLALSRLAVLRHFDIYLHPTQILTVLGLLLFPRGCLAQVKTGEGKSMIVTLLICLCVVQKKSVHVISSDQNLAMRDQQKYEAFFKKFGIITSAICEENPPACCFEADVLYGTATDFEFAIMREILYRKSLFKQNPTEHSKNSFDCVIVDEVDNLTIDTSLSGARLGCSAEKTYDWIYPALFRFVQHLCPRKDVPLPCDAIERAHAFFQTDMDGRFCKQIQEIMDNQLENWLNSARHALFNLQEKVDYIVRDEQVQIIDAPNTGRILKGCRWSYGIHEFVEIKHGISIQRESLVPIALSHPIYYTFYQQIFGLSGTIGSACEREEISEIYGINSFDVPTYSPVRRIDLPPELCEPEIHSTQVTNRIINYQKQGRPVLVLCETIQETDKISALLVQQSISHETLNEEQTKSELEILAHAGGPGAITIATNTAGRGADICLDSTSIQNGGLHALLTYFPESERVEWQGRGRAGRQGQPGSSELLVAKKENACQLKDFIAWRERKVESKKNIHMRQAQIDRLRFSFVEKFFKKVSAFHTRLPTTVGSLARDFAQRRLIDHTPVSFERLALKDRALAQEAFVLMTTEHTSDNARIRWQVIFNRIAERIHTLILNDWAIRFYQKINDLIEEVEKMTNLTKIQSLALSDLEKGTIEDIFHSQMMIWEQHLDPEGKGIVHYLREIRSGRPLSLESFQTNP